jgi:PEP-CTERM motif
VTPRYHVKPGRVAGWAVLTGLGLLCLTSAGRAEVIAFGNTRYRHTETVNGLSVTIDGTLNAAVFKRQSNTGDIWGTGASSLASGDFTPGVSPGAGSPALDTHAQYLYVYQLVNDGGSAQTIGSVGLTVKQATSWGSFASLTLNDAQGQVNNTNPLGTNGGAFDNTFRSGSGAVTIGAATPPGIAVNQVELKPNGAGPGFDSFRAVWSINGPVDLNGRSALFAFTSNAAPSVAIFSAQGATSVNSPTLGTVTGLQGGTTGGTPSGTPEPSTLALAGLGLSCLAARAWRRYRASAS